MKLRLYGDSLRLRLSPADIVTLQRTGQVGEVTHFGKGSDLHYRLEACNGMQEISADFDGANVVVRLPRSRVTEWAESDEVGICHQQVLPGGGGMTILLEKDFECLHSEEREAGVVLFPNPNSTRCEPQ